MSNGSAAAQTPRRGIAYDAGRLAGKAAGPVLNVVEEIGNTFTLMGQAFFWLFRRPFRWRQMLQSMEFIGVDSIPVILLVGLFVGAAFSLQTVSAFRMFSADAMVGSTVTLALCRELGPVLAAIMVTARVGSAMATELGSMRITEQIDALHTMAVNPVQYLVTPRIVASIIMVPLLNMVFVVVGVLGAYLVAVGLLGVDKGYFLSNIDWYVDIEDIVQGLVKASVFGLALSSIGCYQGFYAKGGARGVGLATTRAVVQACVTILVLDYFLTDIFFAV